MSEAGKNQLNGTEFSLSAEGVRVVVDDLISKYRRIDQSMPVSDAARNSVLGTGIDRANDLEARRTAIMRIAGIMDYVIPIDRPRTWYEEIGRQYASSFLVAGIEDSRSSE